MNHYVNGITNVSMTGGVITFDFVSVSINDKGETNVRDEVQISMNPHTFSGFMQICTDFINKVKEDSNKVPVEESGKSKEQSNGNEPKQ